LLYFEIWDDNFWDDTFIGGLVVYSAVKDAEVNANGELMAEYTDKILWDLERSLDDLASGHARVPIRGPRDEKPQPIRSRGRRNDEATPFPCSWQC